MVNVPQPAEELTFLDRELAHIEARKVQLLARRSYLLSLLTPPVPVRAPVPVPAPRPVPDFPGPVPVPGFPAPAPETSPPSAQNVLLTLGGLLLTVAAIAFTLVSWGEMGIGGRAAVLATVTVAALTAPAVLLRRGLTSTAESVGALGLVLTGLDAYALHRVALPSADALGYTAAALAVLSAVWAAYGLLLGKLRMPLPAAVLIAQLPLPLWSLAADAGEGTIAWALLVTAALNMAAALWKTAPDLPRSIAGVAAWVTGGWALLIAGTLSVTAAAPLDAAEPAALLLTAAGLGLFVAFRSPAASFAAASVAGLAAVAAAGGVVRAAVPVSWGVVGYLLCAAALLTALRWRLPHSAVRGLCAAAGAVVAGCVLWALPSVALTLLGPLSRATDIWSGAPAGVRDALGTDPGWSAMATSPLVLLLAAALLTAAHRHLPTSAAAAALPAGTVLIWASVLVLPAALDLGYGAAVATQLALTAATPALAVILPSLSTTALPCALTGALSVSVLSLADERTTLLTLGIVLVLLVAAAIALNPSRTPGTPPDTPARFPAGSFQGLLACLAVGYAIAFDGAVAASAGLAPRHIALAVLAVPAAVALLAATPPRRHPVALPVELTAAGAGLLAVILATGNPPYVALVLALCAVIAAGTALRPERRPAAGYVAAVLFVLATWVRLYASDVSTPEAYTLPVTVPALAVGLLRHRSDPRASSWTAYGPGLAATLVPSLFAAWGDPHWLRPLALGTVALALTLVGARLRLQAPLVLGGAVLALVALHELAPYVVQVVGALPRWLPPALAGLLLLVVGATYERRLHEARRLRESLGRMR